MDNKFCKFYKWRKYVSYDNGTTWSPLDEYMKGDLYETLSVDCGAGAIIYRWVLIDEYECEEVQDKYTYYFTNGDGIVIGCEENEVSINNEYASFNTYMSYPSENLDNMHIAVGVSAVTIHNCVSTVPQYFASGFIALKNATIESGITSIDSHAFSQCYSLKSVTMPNTVETLGGHCFEDCQSLSGITLSNNLTFIDRAAFKNCSKLLNIQIPSACTKIGYIYDDLQYPNYAGIEGAFENCVSLTSITLNEGIEVIGAQTFNYCRNLKSFEAPSTLRILGYNGSIFTLNDRTSPTHIYNTSDIGLFEQCTSLSSVTLNEGLEVIGNNAFRGCTSLTSVTIPSTVANMYMSVFSGCTSLEYVKSLPTTPPIIGSADSIGTHAAPFNNTNNCPIYVPDESVEAYKSANIWSDYKSRIKPLSEFNG